MPIVPVAPPNPMTMFDSLTYDDLMPQTTNGQSGFGDSPEVDTSATSSDAAQSGDATEETLTAENSASSSSSSSGDDTSTSTDPAAQGWLDVYNDRLRRMQEATDPALKAHFQAELDVMKPTLRQMGLPIPDGGGGESGSGTSTEETPPASGSGGTDSTSGSSGSAGSSGTEIYGSLTLGGSLPPALAQYKDEIEAAAEKTGVPANVIAAMIWQESRGIVSTPGGGLGQITPERFAELQAKHPELRGGDLSDAATNILALAYFMKDLIEEFGDVETALRAYNSGPNGVDPNNLNATPAGTGDPTYVSKVMSMASTISSGGELPA